MKIYRRSANCLFAIFFVLLAGLTIRVNASCVDFPPGLVGWWRAENDAYDLFGGNHGLLQGGVTFVPGKVGQAFHFDGINDSVRIPFAPALNVGDQITVEFWMKADADNGMLNCCQGLVTSDFYDVSIGGGGPQTVGINAFIGTTGGSSGTTGDANGGGVPISSNEWHHIAFTYDGTSLQLYIDGQSWGNPLILGGPIRAMLPNSFLAFGSSDGRTSCPSCINTRYFKGAIDEVAIYNRALQPFEIASIYNASGEGKCIPPPIVVSDPANQTVFVGAKATFSTIIAGAPPISYQWLLNGTNIPFATNATLNLTNVQLFQSGTYILQASNLQGSTNSAPAVLTVAVPPACALISTGMVSWWRAEDNAYDQLGNNSATQQGGATFADAPLGRAFSFNGSTSYIKIPQSPTLRLTNQFTLEFWMKADATNPMTNCCQGLVTSDYFGIVVGGGGSQRVGIIAYINTVAGGDATTGDVNGGGVSVSSNEWHHIASTYDGTKLQLYIDGQASGNPNFRPGPLSSMLTNSFVAIGSESGRSTCPICAGSRFFKGLIDEACIYNRALTSNEVAAIYDASISGKCVVTVAPSITVQPTNRTAIIGSNVTFTAQANGTPPLNYQWRFNGAAIANATNSTLSLTNVRPNQAGLYSVQVSNTAAAVVSSNASLTVMAIFVYGNGQPLTNNPNNFTGSPTIQIQTLFTNGSIFYTLDGSQPSFASTAYAGPFVVTSNVTLRVLGYSADFSEFSELGPIFVLLPPIYTLSATTAGGGSVAFNPPGGSYFSNATVSVTATQSAGWTFLHWLGDLAGSNNPASITMSRNKQVQPVFGTTLSTSAAGNGSVIKIPDSSLYPYGSVVRLAAIPQAGNYFGVWGNAASGNVNPLSFTVTNANQTVSALFAPLGGGQAALTVIPDGFGRVTVSPQANVYSTGAGVTLTALPDAGQSFIGWSGDATGSSNQLNITMTTSKVITASFTTLPRLSANPPVEGLLKDGFRFSLFGEFNRSYQIDVTTNIPNWAPLTILTNYYTQVQYLDPAGTNKAIRFYRAMRLP